MVMNLHNRRAGVSESGTVASGGPKSIGSESTENGDKRSEPRWRDMEATIEKVF